MWLVCQDALRNASDEHKRVLRVLLKAAEERNDEPCKRTQGDIVRAVPRLGAHKREVEAGVRKEKDLESTKRNVRQILRDLRVDYGIPVISSNSGYWLPRTQKEVDAYVDRKEGEARASAASYFETFRAVRRFSSRERLNPESLTEGLDEDDD